MNLILSIIFFDDSTQDLHVGLIFIVLKFF